MELTISPNWHIAVVHFPIALLAVGLFAEVVGALFGAAGLRQGGRWMLLFGAFASLPVAASGYVALQDVVSHSSSAGGMPWREMAAASSFTPRQWDALLWHAKAQTLASVVMLFTVALYLASGDTARRYFYLLGLFLLGGALLFTLVGAHLGGEAVYTHATGVGRPPASLPAEPKEQLALLAPPMELHALLAGATASLGILALATAHRNVALQGAPRPTPILVGNRRPPPPPALLPAPALLLLAGLLALATATAGTWFLARGAETWAPRELWQTVLPVPPKDLAKPENAELLRRPVHVGLGLILAAVPLLLALWHKWRPEGRFLLVFFGMLYVGAVVAQLPLGALMLLDGPTGPLVKVTSH